MNRSEQRKWIVKIIFQHSFNDVNDIKKTLENLELSDNEFIENSIKSILNNMDEIDSIARKYITQSKYDTISTIDKSILRVSINEFYIEKKVPISVSINEAVEIAKEYSSEGRHKFINGVLSSIAKEMK